LDRIQSTSDKISNNEAEFCGRMPLHQTNQIQPHGVLLVVKKDDLTILQASENTESFFGLHVSKLINTSLYFYVSPAHIKALREKVLQPVYHQAPIILNINGNDFLAMIQMQDEYFIADIERVDIHTSQNSFVDIYHEVKSVMAGMDFLQTTHDACAVIAKELKRISGFDKVMIYRFDPDWNGEVIAEAMEAGMESYYGLKFPATDIPKPARELYKVVPYRLIPDIDYEPVKLYPVINPLTGTFTNLTNSGLRSVVSVHLQYLRNMNVKASMSTRILKDGELWGLIACHHRSPMHVSYQLRSMFEMLSLLITEKIAAVQNNDVFHFKSEMHMLTHKVMEGIYRKGDLLAGFIDQSEEIKRILNADGIAITYKGQIASFGKVPGNEEIKDIVFWLQANNMNRLYHQPALSTVFDNALDYAKQASGLLALPLHPENSVYILSFRQEEVQTISWGGNPNEAVQFENDGKQYHPRSSFKIWQETVELRSRPWNESELDVAENLRNLIIQFILNKS